MMDSDQLLNSLGLALNVPDLRFDANGCARLAIVGAPPLDFERGAADVVHVYSVLGSLPPEGREALYEQMLHGNLFGASTAGASLAIDPLQGEIVLCRTVVCETTSAHAFVSQVEAFVAAAEDWKGRIAGAPADSPADTTFPASQMMQQFVRG